MSQTVRKSTLYTALDQSFECKGWYTEIERLLKGNWLCRDTDEIVIPDNLLTMVDNLGTPEMKKWLKGVGIKLKSDLEIKLIPGKPGFIHDTEGDIVAAIRKFHELKDMSIWLTSQYDWTIKKDKSGSLCLIPTKKK